MKAFDYRPSRKGAFHKRVGPLQAFCQGEMKCEEAISQVLGIQPLKTCSQCNMKHAASAYAFAINNSFKMFVKVLKSKTLLLI